MKATISFEYGCIVEMDADRVMMARDRHVNLQVSRVKRLGTGEDRTQVQMRTRHPHFLYFFGDLELIDGVPFVFIRTETTDELSFTIEKLLIPNCIPFTLDYDE